MSKTDYISEITSSRLATISKILNNKNKDINKLEELRNILLDLSKLLDDCNTNNLIDNNSLSFINENIKRI